MENKTDLLSDYKWKNRILIVYYNSENNLFQKQMQLFYQNREGLKERDLVIFQIHENKEYKKGITPKKNFIPRSQIEEIKEQFNIWFSTKDVDNLAVFLVGKDGTTKLKVENEILTIKKLFETIDAMPMRKREMKEDNNKK